jgi:hypothetical protein
MGRWITVVSSDACQPCDERCRIRLAIRTGKWPAYYPDSLGSVVDIGPGCPTGIMFGTGAKFPQKYQKSLFISDWSYGVIYAVHMTADGSSYKGEAERFIFGAPLPVTDIVINPIDQAMYFTIGGRKTQSGIVSRYLHRSRIDCSRRCTIGSWS